MDQHPIGGLHAPGVEAGGEAGDRRVELTIGPAAAFALEGLPDEAGPVFVLGGAFIEERADVLTLETGQGAVVAHVSPTFDGVRGFLRMSSAAWAAISSDSAWGTPRPRRISWHSC